MDSRRLQKIFEQYQFDASIRKHRDSVVMVVDGLNLFIRAFASNPMMNHRGEHIGGLLGFLRSLFFYIRKFNPTRVIIAFDGKDGSLHRQQKYAAYKSERKVKDRYNRASDVEGILDEEAEFRRQIERLDLYLENLPFDTLILNHLEGDDVIAYIVNEYYKYVDNNRIYVISTDKDFLQLVSDKVWVYSPTKRKLYDKKLLNEEYGLSPNNYLIMRVLCGDTSDNITGIRGAGLKTIKKLIPEILERDLDIDDLVDIIQKKVDGGAKYKFYNNILESQDVLRRNWDLMQLDEVDVPLTKKFHIKKILDESTVEFDKMEFRKLLSEDGLLGHISDNGTGQISNFDSWVLSSLNNLQLYARII
jgi:5'-3' exonuclease